MLVGTVPPVAPELIKSMQEQQRELTQALLDKAKAICEEHGVCRRCKSGRYTDDLSVLESSEQGSTACVPDITNVVSRYKNQQSNSP